MYEDEFALRLAQLRSKKGVSARDMSLSIGQNAGYINSIESGKEISAELKRQGNNLNQAVKNIYFGDITEQELLSVVDDCKSLYRRLSSAIGGS